MKQLRRLSVAALCAVAASAASFGWGCESTHSTSDRNLHIAPLNHATPMGGAKAKAEPKAEPKAEAKAPAAAPAPMAGNVTEMFFPTGDKATSALWLRQRMPAEVRVGQPFEYTIDAINLTNNELKNVVINADSFQNLGIVSSNPASTKNAAGQTVWSLGDLGPKQTKTITVQGRAEQVGVSSNCLTPSYATILCAQTRVVAPALKITKSITPETILGCQTIKTVLEVTNTGSGAATNVKLTDALPAGLTYNGQNRIEQPVGTLAAGETKRYEFSLKADKAGRYENDAQVSADGGLNASTGKVAVVVKQVALQIACKAPERVFVGRNATFAFTVKNTGDAACENTTITVPLTDGSFVSATEGGTAGTGAVTWNLGSLAAGASKTVELTIKPKMGNVAVSATAACTCAQPATTSCNTNVVGIPALLLDGVDNPDPIEVGQTVTYTLRVTNQGSAPLTNVSLMCDMQEDSMAFVSQTGPTQGTVTADKINFAPIATLGVGEYKTYTVVVRATKAGQVSFRAEAKSSEITVPLIKAETTNFYQ